MDSVQAYFREQSRKMCLGKCCCKSQYAPHWPSPYMKVIKHGYYVRLGKEVHSKIGQLFLCYFSECAHSTCDSCYDFATWFLGMTLTLSHHSRATSQSDFCEERDERPPGGGRRAKAVGDLALQVRPKGSGFHGISYCFTGQTIHYVTWWIATPKS